MSRERSVRGSHIVLYDLTRTKVISGVTRKAKKERTVLKAVNVAIHLAFAPVILKSENWSARRRMAGWMSPLTVLTGFGRPKCEKMRRPRELSGGKSVAVAPAPFVSFGPLLDARVGVRGVGSTALFCFLAGGADEDPACPPAFAAAFAAR